MLTTLPSSAELPCSDDTPVDNESQNLLPNILLFLLRTIWHDRLDWFFGVDMAVYHTTGASLRVPVVPDAFLSLGVPRWKGEKTRLSYVLWEENYVPPIMVLEMVSHTPGKEYLEKMKIYQRLGVLYYIIYNPEYWRRDRHQPFEVYKLIDNKYQLQSGEPYWMEEVGLGIGRWEIGKGREEQLAWYDREGDRFLTSNELAKQERQEKERALQEKERALQEKERERQQKERALKEKERERQEKEKALQEKERALQSESQALQEKERALQSESQALQEKEKFAQYLRSIGVDPDRI